MYIKKTTLIFILITLFILTIVGVNAEGAVYEAENADFKVKITEIRGITTIEEKAVFDIKVTNKKNTKDLFDVSFGELEDWRWAYSTPDYFILSTFDIKANGEDSGKLNFQPKLGIKSGQHNVEVITKNNAGRKEIILLPVFISSGLSLEYTPDLIINTIVSENVDPREELEVKVQIQNRNRKNLKDVKLKISSELINIEKEFDINELEKKTETYKIKLNPLETPHEDILRTVITAEEYVFQDKDRYNIIDYTGDYTKEIDEDKIVLKTTQKITFRNDGNSVKAQLAKIETSWLKNMFTKTVPKAEVQVIDSQKYLTWELDLKPTESEEVIIVTNYRSFLAAIIIIIIVIFIYLRLRSPVRVIKSYKKIKQTEGGITEVSVVIEVKNTGIAPIEKIKITDKIPHLIELIKDFPVGTLKPSKVLKHEKKGSVMIQWELDELEPHEHRILNYRIKPKLTILGGLTLPIVVVKYHDKKGKLVKVRSNRLSVTEK